jgi:GrpB-like predicted nucleotidyltransferase (UPF0157 family)
VSEPSDGTPGEVELVGGREPREIRIFDWSPAWPARFHRERERIAAALGSAALRIEHVGSTSVPGLAAEPIVDIAVEVESVDDESAYLPALESAGYALRVREAGHRMLRTPARDVHVHLWPRGCEELRRQLLLRDHLRRSPEDCERYAAVKRTLARRDWADTNDYAAAKSDCIAAVLERAARARP